MIRNVHIKTLCYVYFSCALIKLHPNNGNFFSVCPVWLWGLLVVDYSPIHDGCKMGKSGQPGNLPTLGLRSCTCTLHSMEVSIMMLWFLCGWGMLSSLSTPIVSANQFKIFHAGQRCNTEGPCSSLDNLCIADNERWPLCSLQINAFADSETAYVCISFCCLLDTYQLVAIIW